MKKSLFSWIFLLFVSTLYGRILSVGPNETYKTPSQVSKVVRDGDTVYIQAGVYPRDVAFWKADNLYIRGVGGYAHMKSGGRSAGQKAIWVIQGNNITVEYIEFSECAVSDHNGAGIRQEGVNLTVRHCYFHDNEEGILAGDSPYSKIVIASSEFAHNGYGRGFTHHIYLNHVKEVEVRYCYFHHVNVGHHIKSRALHTLIAYNRIGDENTGNSSRLIDIPNGGESVIIGNILQQGPSAENSNLIGYGLEGLTNGRNNRLYLVNNTLVNTRHTSLFVQVQSGADAYMVNNIFAGKGKVLSGTSVEDSHNFIQSDIEYFGFNDADNFDYTLTEKSPAIDAGTRRYTLPDSLRIRDQYGHPLSKSARNVLSADSIDVGAYEYRKSTGTPNGAEGKGMPVVCSNPCFGGIVRFDRDISKYEIVVYTLSGSPIKSVRIDANTIQILSEYRGVGVLVIRQSKELFSIPFAMQ